MNYTMLKADGFDDCVIGVYHRCGDSDILAYSADKIIAKLSADMPEYEAIEYFEFNILGAYVGEGTPCFIYEQTMEEIEESL